jgi:hypothetical protein
MTQGGNVPPAAPLQRHGRRQGSAVCKRNADGLIVPGRGQAPCMGFLPARLPEIFCQGQLEDHMRRVIRER